MQPKKTILNDRYKLLDVIGDGGMARVYRAHDMRLDRVVAIKLPHPELEGQVDAMRRFEREARLVARLSHPHIVATYDVGCDGEARYLVMEHVDGGSLRGLLHAGRLPPARAVAIMEQVGRALDAAHAQGIVHRDVKPENVLLTAAGQVKVSDFGIAHALGQGDQTTTGTTGLMFGSVAYVAPEQALGEPVTPAADIYSSGVILYEMLTGQPPFAGASSLATAMAHLTQEARPPCELAPELPAGVDAVVFCALDKAPERRYPSGAALSAALAVAVAGVAIPAAAVISQPAGPVTLGAASTGAIPHVRTTAARFLGVRRLTTAAVLLLAGTVGAFALSTRPHDASPASPARTSGAAATSVSGTSRELGSPHWAIIAPALPARPTQSLTPTGQPAGTDRPPASLTATSRSPQAKDGVSVIGSIRQTRQPVRRQTGAIRMATPPALPWQAVPVTMPTPRAAHAPFTHTYTSGNGQGHHAVVAPRLTSDRTSQPTWTPISAPTAVPVAVVPPTATRIPPTIVPPPTVNKAVRSIATSVLPSAPTVVQRRQPTAATRHPHRVALVPVRRAPVVSTLMALAPTRTPGPMPALPTPTVSAATAMPVPSTPMALPTLTPVPSIPTLQPPVAVPTAPPPPTVIPTATP